MRYRNTLLGMCCALALTASPVLAADTSNTNMGVGSNQTGANSTMNADRKVGQAEDGEWIRLSGTVSSVSDDAFTLDYGKDKITVETDDFASDTLRSLKKGDRVTVSGRIDDGFFSSKDIVASTVHMNSSNQTLSANRNEMDASRSVFPGSDMNAANRAEDGEWVSMTGKVSKMDGDEFTIQTGSQSVAVDASDADGFDDNRLRIGDRVSVSGEIDEGGLFDDREIEASSVVILSSNAPNTGGAS